MGSHQEYQQLAGILANLARCALGKDKRFNKIEVSCYGNLHDAAEAFLPICAGVLADEGPIQNEQEAQALLDSKGYPFPEYGVDGEWGEETTSALNLFKSDHNLQEDGCGPETWAALIGT